MMIKSGKIKEEKGTKKDGRVFLTSTEWTTMFMNCMHATINSIWNSCGFVK